MAEKTKKKRTRKYVPRNTIQFQMDLRKPADLEVLKIHEWAASSGKAVQMFRDGFRLINALQQGDTTLLLSMFPDLDGSLTPHDENLLAEFRAALKPLASKIDDLHQLPLPLPGMQPAQTGGLKALGGAVAISMPTFEDEDDKVIVRRDLTTNVNANFMDSVLGLQPKTESESS